MSKMNIWKRINFDSDGSDGNRARITFLASHEGEAITGERSYHIYGSTLQVADFIAKQMEYPHISSSSWDYLLIQGMCGGHPILVSVYNERRELWRQSGPEISPLRIAITGHRSTHAILDLVDKEFAKQNVASIKWWYFEGNNRPDAKTIYLPPLTTSLRPEFYPDLVNPKHFLERYLASEAPVLLVAGEPGTGKTTLLRHLIQEFDLTAHVTYDEKMINRDSIFQSFLFDEDSDILIIEDADTILASREAVGNSLMARFLNVSDGLVKYPNKKIVFTTNLSDFGKVDAALIRPGRCYAVVHTRPLNLSEAQAAAKVAKLPIPTERREYTLAELFNQEAGQRNVRRVGY